MAAPRLLLALVGVALCAAPALAHSYVSKPVTRSNQAQTWRGELVGPCDKGYDPNQPRATVKRGDVISLQWPRNNHPGGIIRVAWALASASGDHASFDAGVTKYSCHEYPCTAQTQCDNVLSPGCTPCEVTAAVPAFAADGVWTVQWVWYGGGFGLSPYYSCVDYTVSGGVPVESAHPKPVFVGGDATYPQTCWLCATCDTKFRNGPTLSDLVAGYRPGGNASPVPVAPTSGPAPPRSSAAPPTSAAAPVQSSQAPPAPRPDDRPTVPSDGLCAGVADGIACFPGDCCDQYVNCVGGKALSPRPVAPGTLCKGGVLVHTYDCKTPCQAAGYTLPTATILGKPASGLLMFDVDASTPATITVQVTGNGTKIAWTFEAAAGRNPIAIGPSVTGTTLSVSRAAAGEGIVRVVVTDARGSVAQDSVAVRVSAVVADQPPVASAGKRQDIVLPTSAVTLDGSASSDDKGIVSYLWSLVSGPNTPNLATPTASTTGVSGLVAGTYTFRLTVKDAANQVDRADVVVTVDVNECADGNNGGCSVRAACTNTFGGRLCTCLVGYKGDGITCSVDNSGGTTNPDNGQPSSKPCTGADKETLCWPRNCAPQYYTCARGVASDSIQAPSGYVCYGGNIVRKNESDICRTALPDGTPANHTEDKPTPVCGDGYCFALSESCSTCPRDCGACPPRCGDGACNGAETCGTCQSDCGACKPSTTTPYRNIGYYTNWAQYRSGGGGMYKFFPEDIDATLFTHIAYGFAKVTANYEIQAVEWNDILDYAPGMYKRFHTHVRSQNPAIRTLISLGGWNFNADGGTSSIFTTMAASDSTRRIFARNCIAFARANDFDGVDIDWEYPGDAAQGGRAQDKANYVEMLKAFRDEINKETVPAKKERLLLTIAVGAGESTINNGYDVSQIHNYVDWVGLMSYDLHGSWEALTGAHTALFDSKSTLSIDFAVTKWLSGGMPPSKLVLGLASYGRSWELSAASNSGMGASARGAGAAGPYTAAGGFLSYYEILGMLRTGATATYHDATKSMYAVQGTQWVSYDNERTLGMKVDYLVSRKLGGSMFWAIDLDDFRNGYPLIGAVAQRLYVKTTAPLAAVVRVDTSASVSSEALGFTIAAALASRASVPPSSVRVLSTSQQPDGSQKVEYVVVEDYDHPAAQVSQSLAVAACAGQSGGVSITSNEVCYMSGGGSSGLAGWAIAVIVVCCVVGVAAAAGVAVLVLRRRQSAHIRRDSFAGHPKTQASQAELNLLHA